MLQYHSDIEQCEVAQNIDVHGSIEGKAEEGAEDAVRDTSVYAVSYHAALQNISLMEV